RIALVRITPAAALNLSHRLCSWIAAQTLVHRDKLPVVVRNISNLQVLGLLIYALVAIRRAGVIAEETAAAAAALALNCLKHVRQIPRIVTGVGHDARAEKIGFSFVFATELQEVNTDGALRNLSCGWARQNTAEDSGDACAERVLLCFCCLRCSVTQRDVAKLVRHHPGHLAFITRGLNHSAVYVHRSARQRERVDVARIDDFEVVTKFRVLKLRRNSREQSLAD